MPLGHLVDVIWRWKFLLVYAGAGLIAASLLIMYALVTHPDSMAAVMDLESWFVLSVLLAPTGYVIQDAVADAMSVEAVPRVDKEGRAFDEPALKALHTTMQTFGRMAVISGLVAVAAVNIILFDDVELLSAAEKTVVYGRVYLIALVIPLISISGVSLASSCIGEDEGHCVQPGSTIVRSIHKSSDRLNQPRRTIGISSVVEHSWQ